MKLEIELDLNKIDYDAINKQIQEKIANMDLSETYEINSKINRQIKEEVECKVNHYLEYNHWNGICGDARRDIKGEIIKNIKELIKPHVENVFNQIPQEELNTMIHELIPTIFIDLLTSRINDSLSGYYNNLASITHQICEEKIRSMLNR